MWVIADASANRRVNRVGRIIEPTRGISKVAEHNSHRASIPTSRVQEMPTEMASVHRSQWVQIGLIGHATREGQLEKIRN